MRVVSITPSIEINANQFGLIFNNSMELYNKSFVSLRSCVGGAICGVECKPFSCFTADDSLNLGVGDAICGGKCKPFTGIFRISCF